MTISMFILEKNGNIDYSKELAGPRCQKNRLALSLGGDPELESRDRVPGASLHLYRRSSGLLGTG